MDALWAAAEVYYDLSSDEEISPATMSVSEYSRALAAAQHEIQEAQIALDGANINLATHKRPILAAIKRAKSAAEKTASSQGPSGPTSSTIFSAVMRTLVPQVAPMFDAVLKRKKLSFISIRPEN
jgi:hypothetical protein